MPISLVHIIYIPYIPYISYIHKIMMEYERTHPILGGSSFTLFCLTDSHCTIAFLRMELPSSTAPSDPPRGWDLQWSGTLAKPFGGKTAQECWKWLGGVLLVCICKYIQYIYIYMYRYIHTDNMYCMYTNTHVISISMYTVSITTFCVNPSLHKNSPTRTKLSESSQIESLNYSA